MTFETCIDYTSNIARVEIIGNGIVHVTLKLECDRLVIILDECLQLRLKTVHTRSDLIRMISDILQDIKFLEAYSVEAITMHVI